MVPFIAVSSDDWAEISDALAESLRRLLAILGDGLVVLVCATSARICAAATLSASAVTVTSPSESALAFTAASMMVTP